METSNNNNNHHHNHNINPNTTINTHSSAPLPVTSTPMSSSLSTTPAETRPVLPHSASTFPEQHHSFSAKNPNIPASLKLRREMTQPALHRIEFVPSSDSPIEKPAINDNYLFHYRSNINNINTSHHRLNQNQQIDVRQKQGRINPTHLSIDYLPFRQISKSKVNNPLPSPRGKKTKSFSFSPTY